MFKLMQCTILRQKKQKLQKLICFKFIHNDIDNNKIRVAKAKKHKVAFSISLQLSTKTCSEPMAKTCNPAHTT